MKQHFAVIVLAILIAGLCVSPVFSQATGSVKGIAKDTDGNPITGATVEWLSSDTGRKYTLKTNNKGEYFSLGLTPGKYNVKLSKDGKELWHFNNVTVTLDELTLDFDLKKEQATAGQKQGMSAEQVKQLQEQQAKAQKEQMTVKALNEKLAASTHAGKVDDAIQAFDKVIAADPTKAEAYYWKGVNMIGKATLKGDKMVAPDGTAEAFQKYLELQPSGQFADPAKQMLASIGGTVETNFGKKKGAKK